VGYAAIVVAGDPDPLAPALKRNEPRAVFVQHTRRPRRHRGNCRRARRPRAVHSASRVASATEICGYALGNKGHDTGAAVLRLRLAKLNEREIEFLDPVLVEAADQIGLGALYLRKIAELRAVTDLLFGLSDVVGRYGSGFGTGKEIAPPRALAIFGLGSASMPIRS